MLQNQKTGDKAAEYTTEEMQSLLESISGMYDMARVVDPIECRVLELHSDGTIGRSERCYGIWNAGQSCVNCTSALACRTGCHQEKAEFFNDQVYHIHSNPVKLSLPDGGAYDAVVELVSIGQEERDAAAANDRAAENVDQKATQYHAQHDILTEALNPRAFSELCREAIEKNSGQHWCMITSDIMDFRLVNTLFGVQKGNEVIVRTAELLQRIAQEASGLCGRLGDDRFALLLPEASYREESLKNAAEILAAEFSSGFYTCCIHFGVYEVEDTSFAVSVMCDRANMALRTIHRDLTETLAYYSEAMMRDSLFAQEVVSGFEDALQEGQFQMYLQPLTYENGQILGAEALVRWHRPDGTITMPTDFIEILERARLIHKLDMYIWECAVRQLAVWKGTARQDLTISVNMSARDVYSMDVYQVLTELTDRYHVPSNRLKLEITETALLEDLKKGSEVISKLRENGFSIGVDDFGKGYSSISLLKNIPADILKIDMCLLQEIESKKRSRTILESIIHMATSLEMDVVTEGIETETQLQSLVNMGCHMFQGFYFYKPMPVPEFEQVQVSENCHVNETL